MQCCSQQTGLWKLISVLWQKLPPASIGKTPSDSCQGGPSPSVARRVLQIAEVGQRQAEMSRQNADRSSLLLQTAANNAIVTTLEGN